jgi:AcrR family transcriptional regulator
MSTTEHQQTPAIEKILLAARKLFVEKGFSGTSTSAIACQAGVSKALIYHHFSNKETLWKKVKQDIIENSNEEALTSTPSSNLRQFIDDMINQRCLLYQKNPDLARLIAWQSLAEDEEELRGTQHITPEHLIKQLTAFQEQGQLKPDLDAKLVLHYIFSAMMPLTSHHQLLTDNKQQQQYLTMLSNFIYDNLASNSPKQQETTPLS